MSTIFFVGGGWASCISRLLPLDVDFRFNSPTREPSADAGIGADTSCFGAADVLGSTGFSVVCFPVLQPGISKNKLKSWLLCLQQLHSFIPS